MATVSIRHGSRVQPGEDRKAVGLIKLPSLNNLSGLVRARGMVGPDLQSRSGKMGKVRKETLVHKAIVASKDFRTDGPGMGMVTSIQAMASTRISTVFSDGFVEVD